MMDNVLEAESRRAQRVTHLGRVFVVRDSSLGMRQVAYLQDSSTTGCCVISESPLRVGMELELSLVASWAERDIVVEIAKVRWVDGNRYGLEFLAIDPLERERLRLFLKTMPPVSDVREHERDLRASAGNGLRANQKCTIQSSPGIADRQCNQQDKKSLIESIRSIF